jgi:transcriptional regulator with XRE-family HTH domain
MSDSVGARLRHARELRHLTLQEVSDTTRVRPHYLQALESDDHSAIPSSAQARGFLRIYASFLELDLADLIPIAPAPESLYSPESVPPASVDISAPDADASKTPPSNLWTSLRDRLARRPNREAAATSISSVPAQDAASASGQTGSPQPAAPVRASTEITTKTSRRPKVASSEPASNDGGSHADDVKKNVGK